MVREARLRAGLTQRALAAAAGKSQPTVARIEGRITSPTVTQVSRLVEACGLELRVGLVPRDDSDWSVASANLQHDADARVRQHQAALRFARAGRQALLRSRRSGGGERD
jgi:transcriptional regulator with XRE-family HTH domain